MNGRLSIEWDSVRRSFWFVPGLMVAAAIGLATITVAIDDLSDRTLNGYWLLFGGEEEGARAVLVATAGSMITVAGVVFSLTVVALTLASSQYGPRIVRSFTRDLGNQIVLGTFVASFTYSLLVLRTVRGGADPFVPHLSVTVALLLALAGVAVLVYFVHHTAWSLNPSHVVRKVATELDESADRLYALVDNDTVADELLELPDGFDGAATIRASSDGYVQWVDMPALLDLATETDVVLRLCRRPGHYVIEGQSLAEAYPDLWVDDACAKQIRAAFIVGPERTVEQDIEYAIEQLVGIAARALSPGVNDPFTAMDSLDRLSASLARLADRPELPMQYVDEDGQLRVLAHRQSFADLVEAAFNQTRQAAAGDPAVMIRLLSSLTELANRVRETDARNAVRRQAHLIDEAGRRTVPSNWDREAVAAAYREVLRALESAEASTARSLATAGR